MANLKGGMLVAFLFLSFGASQALADVGFTKQDLELVKGACLAGKAFDLVTEADGSLSIKNLEGKGKLHVGQKSVDVVDVPDSDKRAEFESIRVCIKGYLKGDSSSIKGPQTGLESMCFAGCPVGLVSVNGGAYCLPQGTCANCYGYLNGNCYIGDYANAYYGR